MLWSWLQAYPLTGVAAFLGSIFLVTRFFKQIAEMYFEYKKHQSDAGMAVMARWRTEPEPEPEPEPDPDETEEEEEEEDGEVVVGIRGPSVYDRIKALRGK